MPPQRPQAPALPAFAALAPGPELAAALAGLDPAGLDGAAVIEACRAADRLAGWVAALQVRAGAELSRRRAAEAAAAGHRGDDGAAAELAAACGLSRRAAEVRLDLARQLTECCPATLAALEVGRSG